MAFFWKGGVLMSALFSRKCSVCGALLGPLSPAQEEFPDPVFCAKCVESGLWKIFLELVKELQ